MKADADANKADDIKRKESVEVRNQADQLVFQSKKQLEELKEKMTPEAQGKVNTAITDLETALKGTEPEPIKSAVEALNRVWSEASSQMYANAGAQPDGQHGAGAPPPPPNGDGNGQAGAGGHVENADFEVVDDEKK
jgi:molecular chaperone DnaK